MVLINGVKYACERCIRGHRVTTCNHTDQPLTMIKPKGRPSTTCAHCKELRKSKNANPSGQCTCGRQDKKRLAQKVKEEASCTCKTDPDHCACHKKRGAKRKTKGQNSGTSIGLDLDGKVSKSNGYSFQSLPSINSSQSLDKDISNLLGSPISMNTSFSTGWDTGSISSSNRSPPGSGNTYSNISNGNTGTISNNNNNNNNNNHHHHHKHGQDTSKNTVGLEPLSIMKPITPNTRTKVGEVYIPLTEYVPTSITSSHDQTDSINPLLMGDSLSIYDDGQSDTPNVTYFADTSKSMSYTQLKEQRKSVNNEHVPSQRVPLANTGRSSSFISNISSHDSVISNNDFISSMNSSDSLSSMLQGGNAHHYQDMLHHPSNGRGSGFNPVHIEQSPNVYGFDTDSVRSVEVLSITPSFMDIPESKQASAESNTSSSGYISWKGVNSRRERSVSIHKNHRYDSENKRKRHPLTSANSSKQQIKSMILPIEENNNHNSSSSNENTAATLPTTSNNFNSPADSTNTALSSNAAFGDQSVFSTERRGLEPSFVDPQFSPDFNPSLKQSHMINQNIIDNNSLFSGTSEGNNPSPNDIFPVEFADIDDLMTHL
ncbi:transcriptional activator HAA1 [Kluyveromyces marxianus]|uniref:Transcriptional activator HAA1 n=1 Tax=Kluyveromyces marxianus TaxID=4911 RepID=A0ABX6EV50_KLUMA|nr:transcriptional activator HAA1 [Kluyveromyces marxianus]